MTNLKRRNFIKGASAVICMSSIPLAMTYSSRAKANVSAIEALELPGFKGQYSTAISTTEEGSVIGLIRADTDEAVIWHADGSHDLLGAPTDGIMSQVQSVSSSGISCGFFQNGRGVLQAVIWQDGVWTPLEGLKENTRSRASGINACKIVVGNAVKDGVDSPVYWEVDASRSPMLLPVPSGYRGVASGINDEGIIVGEITPVNSTISQAVVWYDKDRLPHRVGQPHSTQCSFASGISADGTVFGSAQDNTGRFKAVYWLEDDIQLINGIDQYGSKILSVSEAGIAVGSYKTADRRFGLFAWKDGRSVELAGLGGRQQCVFSVSDSGIACGMSQNMQGDSRAVTWHVGSI